MQRWCNTRFTLMQPLYTCMEESAAMSFSAKLMRIWLQPKRITSLLIYYLQEVYWKVSATMAEHGIQSHATPVHEHGRICCNEFNSQTHAGPTTNQTCSRSFISNQGNFFLLCLVCCSFQRLLSLSMALFCIFNLLEQFK